MNKPGKKIIFFGADFPPTGGGIATYSYEWILKSAEHSDVADVKAIILGNAKPRRERLSDKLEVITYKKKGVFISGLLVPFYILSNFRSSIFHSLNLFPIGFWVVFWSKILGRKSAVTFYGTDACTAYGRPLTRRLKSWTVQNATRAITISNFTRTETERVLGITRKIDVILPFLPLKTLGDQGNDPVTIDARIKPDDFLVLSVCRMVERKGLHFLVEAMSKIPDPKIKAVLIGGGPEKERLQKMVSDFELQDRIIFPGRVPRLEPYYRRAQVDVLLSYYIREEGDFEGLGFVLLEAQYYGTPVIGTKSGGIPEAFADGRTGILIPEQNVDAIRDAILKSAKDRALRDRMAKETQKYIYEKYDPEKNIGEYVFLI